MPVADANVEVVKRAIAALNVRDVDAYLEICAPEVELHSPIAGLEGANVGEAGVREFFANVEEATTAFVIEIESLQPVDERRVLAMVRFEMESPGGFALTQEAANLYEVEDGKLRRVQAYLDRDEGLRAAGLAQ
jgi:ketosteroid isomerase-like protein